MSPFSPSYDNQIARRFSVGSLDQKVQNKTALQAEFGWPKEPKRAMLCLPAGMTDALGGTLMQDVLPGILSQQLEIVVLGKGSASYGSLFTKLAKEHSHRVHIIPDQEAAIHKMYAACDMAMFFSDASKLKELTHCLQYGVVPVAPAAPILENYNPVQETGNAFVYEGPTKWHSFAALARALETYKFPFDWRTIQKHCMESVQGK